MTSNTKLKEAYEVESEFGAFYTGGNIEWHNNRIYCQTTSEINILNLEDGRVSQTIGEKETEDSDYIQTFTTNGDDLITSHKSGLLKLWNNKGEIVKQWKYIHKGPIARLCLKEGVLASGGSDGVVRLWDIEHQACTRSLKGCQGVINVVEIFDDNLYASGDDGNILSWNLKNDQYFYEYKSHFSKVISLIQSHNLKYLISCGRDKVIILWKIGEKTPIRTIPTMEAVEGIARLPLKFKLPGFKPEPEVIYVASGGELGQIRVWDVTNSREIYKQENSLITKADDGGVAITKIICNENEKNIAVVSADHNIIIHHLKSFVCLKQFVGFQDEILDLTLVGTDETHLAVATNSADIKLYNNSSMNCQLLKGHTDIVLALTTSKSNPNLLISSGKDNHIRLWILEDNHMTCVGVGMGHTGSVGAIAFTNLSTNFIVSGSVDTCLKQWQLPEKLDNSKESILYCSTTEIAHDKDINCVAISPNDKIIATASQDKSIKLWTDSLTFVGTLKGHKRGVWCVRFSPVDQVILTSSADCTLRLWSISDLSCLKSFQGHESSVLRVEFLSQGMQFISAGADGLLKIFSIKTSECTNTFDHHDGRIWALTVNKDESNLITGGSDSLIVKWKDVSEERKQQRLKEQEEEVLETQKLMNYLQNDQMLKALKLALKLNRPGDTLKIVKRIITKKETTSLNDTIKELKNEHKETLWNFALGWNTNSKNYQPAQLVMNVLINELQTGEFKPLGLQSSLEQALPYTEKHFKRLNEMMKNLNFLTYMIHQMESHTN